MFFKTVLIHLQEVVIHLLARGCPLRVRHEPFSDVLVCV